MRQAPAGRYELVFLQRFDWDSEDGKCHICFRVSEMLNAIAEGKLRYEEVRSPLDVVFARNWVSKRDIRLNRIMAMTTTELNSPVLGVWMPDGSVLLVDGSHRYMARYRLHRDYIDWHLIALGDWQAYATITGELKP